MYIGFLGRCSRFPASVLGNAFFHEFYAVGLVQRVAEPPSDDVTAVHVYHCIQIHVSMTHGDICDVRAPYLVGDCLSSFPLIDTDGRTWLTLFRQLLLRVDGWMPIFLISRLTRFSFTAIPLHEEHVCIVLTPAVGCSLWYSSILFMTSMLPCASVFFL